MSRCFPFPPPGYEKKPKIDETDILTKEKQKEKNYTKDKKAKRKREGKEKKDKERSEKEKEKEKKDRKEKHKDDKDRDKNKGKNDIPAEKRIEVQPVHCNGESNVGANNLYISGKKDSKFVLELDRRIRDEDKTTGSQMAQKITVREQRRCELPGMAVESNPFGWVGEEKISCKREFDGRVNGQRNKVEATGPENSIAYIHGQMGDQRVEGMARPLGKNNVQNRIEEKEKFKPMENASKDHKHKDNEGEKKSKSKDRDGDKTKRKEEKAKRKEERAKRKEEKAKKKEEKAKKKEERARKKEEKVSGKINELNKQQAKLEESSQDIAPCGDEQSQILMKSSKDSVCEKSSRKRKDVEINGFLHDHEIRPNKLPRPFSNTVVENGRKGVPSPAAIKLQSDQQKTDTIEDKKERRTNGFIEAQEPIVRSTKPPPATVRADDSSSRSMKPSHPDLKYLNEILSLPKIEESSEFDDQEWLLGANNLQSKRPKVGATGDDRTVDAWAEAFRIESVDVTALPYVVPY